MRQGVFTLFFSAALSLPVFYQGGADLSAQTVKNQGKADRKSGSYAAAYEPGVRGGNRDITPDNCRAGSVSNGSVEVKYPDKKSGSENCSISTYTVKKGDTLYSISRKTGSDIDAISSMNRISGNRITAGMKLKIRTCSSVKESNDRNKTVERSAERKKPADKSVSAGDFSWPLRKVNNYRRDGSEDIKSIGLVITGVPNSDVMASREGIVKKIGYMRGYGRYVAISHDGRYITVYSNLSDVYVKEGARVVKGGAIGRLSNDRTLHFQIGHAGKPVNPLKHLPDRG